MRLKSAKPLRVALTLGVLFEMTTLIAMPLTAANFRDTYQIVSPHPDNPENADIQIKPFDERLDTRSLSLGVTLVVIYAGLSVYLMSPAVTKPIRRANAAASS